MKVVLNNGQYKITIPKELAEERGWGPGTKLRFVEDAAGNITLRPIESSRSGRRRPNERPHLVHTPLRRTPAPRIRSRGAPGPAE